MSALRSSPARRSLCWAPPARQVDLVHLFPRFYDVTGGRITIDGVDVRAMTRQALRSPIGVALQEAVLFHGTIRDNIRLRPPRRQRRRGGRRRRSRAGARLHHAAARWLRHDGRAARRQPFRRPEAAPRHRPRPAARPGHTDPRRQHQRRRRRDRGAHPGRAGPVVAAAPTSSSPSASAPC